MIVVPIVLFGYILAHRGDPARGRRRRWAPGLRPWLWLAPALTFLGVFLVYPTIATIIRSFLNRRGTKFVGLDNYVYFFTSPTRSIALRNNLLWVILLPLLVVGLGLLIAVLVDRVRYESVGQDGRLPAAGDQLRRRQRHLAVHVRARPAMSAR